VIFCVVSHLYAMYRCAAPELRSFAGMLLQLYPFDCVKLANYGLHATSTAALHVESRLAWANWS